MLCDEIVSKGFVEPHDREKDLAFFDKIRRAQKFVLAPDFAQACDELSDNLDDVAKALTFCRLPYPLTWIEVAQNDRPRFIGEEASPILEWQVQPLRVGWLLEATVDDLSAWKAHMMWSTRLGTNVACAIACTMNMKAEPDILPSDYEEQRERKRANRVLGLDKIKPSTSWERATAEAKSVISGAFRTVPTDFGFPEVINEQCRLYPQIIDGTVRALVDIARQDWAGEVQYIEAVLAMMNARNVSDKKTVDNATYNKKRAKQGKSILFDHHLITISMRQKQRMAPRNPSEGEHTEVRRHFVRGHFKARASGIFFWRPFVRGKGALVTKDYKVTA